MKKITSLLLSIVLCFSVLFIVPTTASADKINDGNIRVYINGNKVSFDDTQPDIYGGITMVPMRGIFEAMGADVKWDAATKSITAKRGDSTIVLYIDKKTMISNGKSITLQLEPMIVNGSTLVPIRAISEGLGSDVLWNDYTSSVCIFDYYNKDKFVCSTYNYDEMDNDKPYTGVPDFSSCCGICNSHMFTNIDKDDSDNHDEDSYVIFTEFSYSPSNDISSKKYIEGVKYYTKLLSQLGFTKSNRTINREQYYFYSKKDYSILIPVIDSNNEDTVTIKIMHNISFNEMKKMEGID